MAWRRGLREFIAHVGVFIAHRGHAGDLNIFSQDPANLGSRVHAGPGVGGGWVEKDDGSDANAFNLTTDATNDTLVITVRAEQLADGYDQVQCTASAGTCVAIIHDLLVQRKPENLRSSLVA